MEIERFEKEEIRIKEKLKLFSYQEKLEIYDQLLKDNFLKEITKNHRDCDIKSIIRKKTGKGFKVILNKGDGEKISF